MFTFLTLRTGTFNFSLKCMFSWSQTLHCYIWLRFHAGSLCKLFFASVREVRLVNLFSLVSFCLFVFPSAYCGGLWLASLCVMCKMARLVDDEEAYQRYRDTLDRGSAAFDKLLWNGKNKYVYEKSSLSLVWELKCLPFYFPFTFHV